MVWCDGEEEEDVRWRPDVYLKCIHPQPEKNHNYAFASCRSPTAST